MEDYSSGSKALETGSYRLDVSWKSVLSRYHQIYSSQTTPKKIHFDGFFSKPIVIDGATSKWCDPSLLNAIMCLFEDITFERSRRTFDQHKVFRFCVLETVKEALKLVMENDGSSGFESSKIKMTDICECWISFDEIRMHLSKFQHSKQSTRDKIQTICDSTTHAKFKKITLPHLIQSTVIKICEDDKVNLQEFCELHGFVREGRQPLPILLCQLTELISREFAPIPCTTRYSSNWVQQVSSISSSFCVLGREFDKLAKGADYTGYEESYSGNDSDESFILDVQKLVEGDDYDDISPLTDPSPRSPESASHSHAAHSAMNVVENELRNIRTQCSELLNCTSSPSSAEFTMQKKRKISCSTSN